MIYMNDNLIGFDWEQAEANGFVVVNAPARKIAVFHDTSLVVVAIREGGMSGYMTLDSGDEAVDFCRHILNANHESECWVSAVVNDGEDLAAIPQSKE